MCPFPDILESKTPTSLHGLLSLLDLTMNFILTREFTESQKNNKISSFMEALKIGSKELNEFRLNELRLSHFMQLYEQVEERVLHITIETIHRDY